MKRILIISSAEDQENMAHNEAFVNSIRQRLPDDCHIEWTNFHGICVEMGTDKLQVFLRRNGMALSEFDFVYFKSYFRYSEFAGVIATYLEKEDKKFVCSELRHHIPLTKLTQFARMANAGLPIIKTVFMLTDEFRESFTELSEKLGVPFIFKSIDGKGGDDNFLVQTETQFMDILDTLSDRQFVAQAFIANDSDYRVLIVGGEIKLVIKRQRAADETHLNNTSQGADASLLSLKDMDEDIQALCKRAAFVMQRETAGVDLLFEAGTSAPYILEVNASPQVGTGTFLAEKVDIFSEYFKNSVQ